MNDLYDDPDMPTVAVVRVEPTPSPWGDAGECQHLHLACGCVLIHRAQRRKPTTARCMGVCRMELRHEPPSEPPAQLDIWEGTHA